MCFLLFPGNSKSCISGDQAVTYFVAIDELPQRLDKITYVVTYTVVWLQQKNALDCQGEILVFESLATMMALENAAIKRVPLDGSRFLAIVAVYVISRWD
jgi:hypothetical protein